MKRALLILTFLVGCDCNTPPYHTGVVVETRNVNGHTISAFADGSVEFSHDAPILAFRNDPGAMHDIAVAFEEVSYNAMHRRKAFLDMRFPKRQSDSDGKPFPRSK